MEFTQRRFKLVRAGALCTFLLQSAGRTTGPMAGRDTRRYARCPRVHAPVPAACLARQVPPHPPEHQKARALPL